MGLFFSYQQRKTFTRERDVSTWRHSARSPCAHSAFNLNSSRNHLAKGASTEPRSFEHGVRTEQGCAGNRENASTEPRSFEHGVQRQTLLGCAGRIGFNGAALFRARSASRSLSLCCEVWCFNGAALFRARSVKVRTHHANLGPHASTEPRSFEHGVQNLKTRKLKGKYGFNGAALFRARSG